MLDKFKQQQQKDSNDFTKQQDLLKNIETKLNNLSQNLEKENDLKKRSDAQRKFLLQNRTDKVVSSLYSGYCTRNFYSYPTTSTSC